GEEDLSPHDARRLLGPTAIVGVSVGTGQEAHLATSQGASYVSAGPMFATSTKANAGPAAGESLLRSVRAATRLPPVVIGGHAADATRCRRACSHHALAGRCDAGHEPTGTDGDGNRARGWRARNQHPRTRLGSARARGTGVEWPRRGPARRSNN